MLQQDITITNKLGLHARAASKLVTCASGFAADVTILRGTREVNGKSIMGVLTLAAGMGVVLSIRTCGVDEQQAMTAILQLIEGRFGEDE